MRAIVTSFRVRFGQVLAAHEGRVDPSERLPLRVAQRRLPEEAGDFIQTSGIDQPLHRCLALGTLDAGQQVGFEAERPEVRRRPEREINAGDFGCGDYGLSGHRRLQVNAPV